MSQAENSFRKYLKQLYEFQKQGNNLSLSEFEKWKSELLDELSGSYKIKFGKLQFYTEEDFELPF